MFEKEIIKLLKKETGLKQINLEVPPDNKLGDFAFPCFVLSKKLKKNPKIISKELARKIKPNEFVSKIKFVGPYLNFFINNTKLVSFTLDKVLKEKDKYGSSSLGKGKKALVEHTSINPNAEPHVGRARNALIGDSIVRILKFQDYDVETHFFVNDIGKQIAMLVLAAEKKKVTFKGLLRLYINFNKRLAVNPKIEKDVFKLLYELEKGNNKIKKDFERIVNICIEGQKVIFNKLNINYDFFDYESKYLFDKKTNNILNNLLKKESCFKDSEGRIVINQDEFLTEMRSPYFVLTRSDGTSLYSIRDIAYNIEKLERAPDKNIIVLGEDQKLYFKQISSALNLLGYGSSEVVHYSFVLLRKGKMSTRKGDVVMLSEFMKESVIKAEKEIKKRKIVKEVKKTAKIIGYGALKYNILRVSPEKNVLFDWKTALSFEGETAPYIQYAYARSASILRKSNLELNNIDYSLLKEKEEFNLAKKIHSFPEIIKSATDDLRPHVIAVYLYSLAKAFNEFYHICPCIIEDIELSKARLSLVLSTNYVLKTGLGLLGIDSPKRM